MNKSIKKKHVYFFLYFVFLLIFVYAVQDFQTSKNIWGKQVDRKGVHLALFTLLLVTGLYYFLTNTDRFVKRRQGLSSVIIGHSLVKLFLWIITLWVLIVNIAQGRIDNWSSLVHLGISVLWMLIYHYFNDYLRRFSNAWTQVQVCIMSMLGFYVFSAFYAVYFLSNTYDRIAVVNVVYGVLVFLPWISLLSNKNMRRLGFFLVFLVVLASMKRGAIIVLPLMLSVSMLVEAVIFKNSLRPVVKKILIIILFFGGLVIVDHWSGGFLSERFSQQQLMSGSGRSDLYRSAIEDILHRSQWDLFLGRGSGSSVDYLGTGVHNEWLEFVFSFGIIGALLYALLFWSLFRQLRRLIRKSSPYAPAYAMAITYMLTVGMFGGIYFVHSTLYIMAFYGAVEGMMSSEARRIRTLSGQNANYLVNGSTR